jgi:ABC-type nickel/cobalt efflux system permease component RcnA
MKYGPLCLGLCAFGLLFLMGSWVWSGSVGDRASWTEEQAVEFSTAAAKLHQISHQHGAQSIPHAHAHNHGDGDHRHVSDEELAVAKAAWTQQKELRDDAIRWRTFWQNVLRGIGVTGILLGGMGYLAMQKLDEED